MVKISDSFVSEVNFQEKRLATAGTLSRKRYNCYNLIPFALRIVGVQWPFRAPINYDRFGPMEADLVQKPSLKPTADECPCRE